ncbi:MAG TPA: bifunctional homocysteine S-methyltransferase/methylenetetrahydrofolate reductase [Candidatus Acidoferrales bacterium]|jgi:homocysteine S-methyltransferase|nr:bifunctional homocysteine S-methyltransferase/methylenetetrahydrofolate reductase [Candidatus Acidoferrales bacterium]
MKIDEFNERLRDAILIADGAMGSMLYELAGPQGCLEELNATHPETVFRVHQAYLEAGAQILETNTFGANRHKLAALGLADRVAAINHRGVKIAREAREAARHEVLIAGSIGPLGTVRQVRQLPAEEVREIFREQAMALEERGVDFFLLETFSDVEELRAAAEAIRSFSRMPIVAQLTYSEEGTTFGGTRPQEAWERLKDCEVQAVGANCTVGPLLLLPMLQGLAAVASLPLSAMPNAGFPKRIGDRIVYPKSSPEYFALFAREAAQLGVRILGGCCGTTPEHIRAMAEAVTNLQPARPGQKTVSVSANLGEHLATDAAVVLRVAAREPDSGVWRKIQDGRFVVSVEIDPPKGVSIDRILDQVGRVMASGKVDAIDINSGTLARVGMDALVLAGALEANGVETIPHLTTRDANIIGLQAMLLGAWSIGGVRNVLAITGDPPSLGDHPETSGVYEVDSIGLVKVLARLNQGTDWAGKNLGGATNFTIGVALNPVADDLEEEIRRFREKVEAGAHFAMTQPIFDPAQWSAFLEKFGGESPVPVLVGLWPLTSYKQALRLNNEVPGIIIPEPVLKELEAAGDAARDRGFALARRMLDWAATARKQGIAGAYLIPPFKRYEEVLELFS